MELKKATSISEKIVAELNKFLVAHISLQLDLFNYSSIADKLGFNGFAHFLQVQAQDEVLHQRKIMNYLFQRDVEFMVKDINFKTNTKHIETVDQILHSVHCAKINFLNYTHKIVQLAKTEHDYTTAHFLDWFMRDFAEEIEALKVIHDEYTIANGVYYNWDRARGKRKEPATLKVIVPFYESE